jgi:hypothetical protein
MTKFDWMLIVMCASYLLGEAYIGISFLCGLLSGKRDNTVEMDNRELESHGV